MILEITMIILALATLILLFFLVSCKSVWERLMAINLVTIKIVMLITVYAVMMKSPIVMDISITYSIIGFISVTLVSRFILKGGRLK
ncbi:MAG: MrpF/PhaF family protein [Clostridia bacterium]|nr:MrpF/PhaF family protein [Clostridia bacterium]